VEIRALIGAHNQRLQVPKVLFPALQIDFFSCALCHSTSSSLFEGFLDAPDSGLLHALLKPFDRQSWKVSEQSAAIAIIFIFFQVFLIDEPKVPCYSCSSLNGYR
jgi:hypothetical protein